MHKVVSEDERDSFTVDSKLGLEIPQKVAKINVEELRRGKDERSEKTGPGSGKGVPGGREGGEGRGRHPPGRRLCPYLPVLTDHDVVAVPITDAQHVSGHTVARTGEGELLDGAIQGLPVWALVGRGMTNQGHAISQQLLPKGGSMSPPLDLA